MQNDTENLSLWLLQQAKKKTSTEQQKKNKNNKQHKKRNNKIVSHTVERSSCHAKCSWIICMDHGDMDAYVLNYTTTIQFFACRTNDTMGLDTQASATMVRHELMLESCRNSRDSADTRANVRRCGHNNVFRLCMCVRMCCVYCGRMWPMCVVCVCLYAR